ncbi:AraC family transcriptional regulator [Dyadobacter sp. CY312]|uniref:helix-turn-helix domain-containing protein n=1 Tax=Dyadobacter sp. CY312 TaxID=2907303 RepID=UPI001F1704C3|nr:helix-turn-helix domain-containing protein [Dyadobacter sp. CY312]MCE7044499.1 helix-turn-helix domain-containing protein [Dyadobacter sp. CY312]
MLHIKLVNDRSEIFSKVKNVADKIIQIRLDTGKYLVFSTQISNELKVDYNTFSNLFLSEYGVTPERVFAIRLVEKVKELLVYTEQSFKQIAIALGYNNPSSLSNTLKKYTGFTSTYFKEIRKNKLEIIRRQKLEQSEI